MSRIKVISSTIGQANPSPVTLSGGYRWRKIPDWKPGDMRYRDEITRYPKTPPVSAASATERAERFRAFCEHRTAGIGVSEAGALVGVKERAARRYEQDRLAAIREAKAQ